MLALHNVDGLGPIRLRAVLEYFKDPKIAWEAPESEYRNLKIPQNVIDLLKQKRQTFDPDKFMLSLQQSGIKWVTIFDEKYPEVLRQIYDPPTVLYYKGEILPEDQKALAIVGTRKITGYGQVVTERFSEQLSLAGFTIVSGLARGVDTVAHRSAIKVGRTLAILGGGLNNVYPPQNQQLVEDIIAGHGAVISEFPPDYPSLPGNFPSRNRIIAGLARAVIVTEAASDSGSLITARLALEQGRDIFAVPGPVTSGLSRGPVELIREGARIVFEPKDILDELGVIASSNPVSLGDLESDEKLIWESLENESLHMDELGRKLEFSAAKISGLLLKMEIKGLIKNLGAGVYCRDKV